MPEATTDILVVGGGVIGSAIAYHLARAGHAALVLDQSAPAAPPAASWASAGGIRRQGRDPREALLARNAIARWPTLERELNADLHLGGDRGEGDNVMLPQRIGILHPGEMGISIAASALNAGHAVYWASEGRSPNTHNRAATFALRDTLSVANLCAECPILVSVCPPHAAETVANQVLVEEIDAGIESAVDDVIRLFRPGFAAKHHTAKA